MASEWPMRLAMHSDGADAWTQVRCLELHTGRVNELSFDKQEEHIASCSDDCSVVVR